MTNPESFIEVAVSADEPLMEKLIGVMSQLGFEGFWEDGPTLKCYMSGKRWRTGMFEEIQSIIRFVTPSSASAIPEISLRKFSDQDWNDQWKATITPIHVTERIVIAPTWQHYRAAQGELVLTIDPKMSFGTGYHETTRLILRLMERFVVPGMSVLDIGTGTGILAIAGIKLGAESAVGVDNDEWSYDNALENVRLNNVDDKVQIVRGELSSVPQAAFDMVVANIQLDVIQQLIPEMRKRLADRGFMIVSGLLLDDKMQTLNALSMSGFHVCEEVAENEWIALAARM